MFDPAVRAYLTVTRVARLATADADGHPHAVPVCFALVGGDVVTPIDEKPKSVGADALRRVRDVRENASVALVADHYTEDWDRLGWVQVRGTASIAAPGTAGHEGIRSLREKYDQYADHALEDRPLIRVEPGSVRSWGRLEHREGATR